MKYCAALLACLVCCGCGTESLSSYEPLGRSATLACRGPGLLDSFDGYVLMAFRMRLVSGVDEDPEQQWILSSYREQLTQLIADRPLHPGFRSLCALLNRYWGDWGRLIIIEELGWMGEDAYGFVAAGVTGGTVKVVTNLLPGKSGYGGQSLRLRAPRPDPKELNAALAELDKAGKILPSKLLYFDNHDQPLYIIHDFWSDGGCFTFARCGEPNLDKDAGRSAPLGYAEAARLVTKDEPRRALFPTVDKSAGDATKGGLFGDFPPGLFGPPTPGTRPAEKPPPDPPVIVPYDSPRGRELRTAGRTYDILLARVWQALLGSKATIPIEIDAPDESPQRPE